MVAYPYTTEADKCHTTGRLRTPLINLSDDIATVDEVGHLFEKARWKTGLVVFLLVLWGSGVLSVCCWL